MSNLKIQPPRLCKKCQKEYTPKPGGYNSLYCSKTCKESVKSQPAYNPEARRSGYERLKDNPIQYQKHLASGRNCQRRSRQWLADYKTSRGCKDCGYKEYAAGLELDHEGEKKFTISQIRSSVKRMMDEIESGKCAVRCSRCHAVKTWHEKVNLPYSLSRWNDIIIPDEELF